MDRQRSDLEKEEAAIKLLRSLRPGERKTYYTGFLGDENWAVSVSSEAIKLAEAGRIFLVQRRVGPPLRGGQIDHKEGIGRGFEYIAIGRQQARQS